MEKGRERLTFGKIKIECKPFNKKRTCVRLRWMI